MEKRERIKCSTKRAALLVMVLVQNTWWAQKFRLGSHQTTYSMAHSISEGEKEDKAEEEYESSNNDSDLVLVQLVVEKRVVR